MKSVKKLESIAQLVNENKALSARQVYGGGYPGSPKTRKLEGPTGATGTLDYTEDPKSNFTI